MNFVKYIIWLILIIFFTWLIGNHYIGSNKEGLSTCPNGYTVSADGKMCNSNAACPDNENYNVIGDKCVPKQNCKPGYNDLGRQSLCVKCSADGNGKQRFSSNVAGKGPGCFKQGQRGVAVPADARHSYLTTVNAVSPIAAIAPPPAETTRPPPTSRPPPTPRRAPTTRTIETTRPSPTENSSSPEVTVPSETPEASPAPVSLDEGATNSGFGEETPGPQSTLVPGSTPESTLVPGSTPESTLASGSTPESTLVPGSTPESTSVPGSTPESTSVPGSTPESTLAPGSTPESTSVPGSTLAPGSTLGPDGTTDPKSSPSSTSLGSSNVNEEDEDLSEVTDQPGGPAAIKESKDSDPPLYSEKIEEDIDELNEDVEAALDAIDETDASTLNSVSTRNLLNTVLEDADDVHDDIEAIDLGLERSLRRYSVNIKNTPAYRTVAADYKELERLNKGLDEERIALRRAMESNNPAAVKLQLQKIADTVNSINLLKNKTKKDLALLNLKKYTISKATVIRVII